MTIKTYTIDTSTHKVVPLEATLEMIDWVTRSGQAGYRRVYRAMLAVAPEHPADEAGGDALAGTIAGFPVVRDDTMPPNEWAVVIGGEGVGRGVLNISKPDEASGDALEVAMRLIQVFGDAMLHRGLISKGDDHAAWGPAYDATKNQKDALRAYLAPLLRDAERYAFVRDGDMLPHDFWKAGEHLDAAIDAATAKGEQA